MIFIDMNEGKANYSNGIECPECKSQSSKITDKRNYPDRIWRRRKCDQNHSFTTVEVYGDIDDDRMTKVSKRYIPKPKNSGGMDYTKLASAISKLNL